MNFNLRLKPFFLCLINTNACANKHTMEIGLVDWEKGRVEDSPNSLSERKTHTAKAPKVSRFKNREEEEQAERVLRKMEESSKRIDHLLKLFERVRR